MFLKPIRNFSIIALSLLVVLIASVWHSPARAASENVMLILDASGSMWGRVEGQPKIEVAREVVGNVLRDLRGKKVKMGVMAYGHRSKGECSDIETVIPVGSVDANAYMSVINKLSPKGKTPITDAVRKAANELRFSEEKATVILVSDGLETCAADPCALAKQLEKQGVDFTVHVVGFDLQDKDTRTLQCLAKETGGKYVSAENTTQLGDAIGNVVAEVEAPAPKQETVVVQAKPAVQPTLLKVNVVYAEGVPVERAYVYVIPIEAEGDRQKAAAVGSNSNPYKVKSGKYTLHTKVGNATGSSAVEVVKNKFTTAQINLNAGLLSVKANATEGGKPLDKAYIYVYDAQKGAGGKRKTVTSGNQRYLYTVPAGKYYVTAQLGKAKAGRDIEVKAGVRNDVLLTLASGVLKVDVLANEGGKPQKNAYIYVYESELEPDGKRSTVTQGNQRHKFTLPAGKYYVTATIGKATVGQEIEVVAGKYQQVPIILGAGVIKIDALAQEGGKPQKQAYIYIYEAKAQPGKKRKLVTQGNQRHKFTLPAGKYYVTATIGKATVGKDIDVAAGKFAQIPLVLGSGVLKIDALAQEGGKPEQSAYIYIYQAEVPPGGKRKLVTQGNQRHKFTLPAGNYYVTATIGKATVGKEIAIAAGKYAQVPIVLGAGILKIDALAAEGGKPQKQAYIYIYEADVQPGGKRKLVTQGNQRHKFPLPAGKYYVTATIGKATVGKNIEIIAGKFSQETIVLAAGILKVDALAKEGGKPQKDAYVYIYEAKQQADGKRRLVTQGNQRHKFPLPAGKYYVTATVGKATVGQDIELSAGKFTQAAIIIGVGALKINAVPAEGAKPMKGAYVTIYSTEKQLDGTRKRVTNGRQRTTFKLPAGKYFVVTKLGFAVTSGEIDVKAGVLTAPTVNLNAGSLFVKADRKVYVELYSGERNLDGTRDKVGAFRAGGKPAIVTAGKYFVVGTLKGKKANAEVEIKAGKFTEVDMPFN